MKKCVDMFLGIALFLCVQEVCVAEDGYIYGMETVDDAISFGRVNIENGELDVLIPSLGDLTLRSEQAAIDTRRYHYYFSPADGRLATIDIRSRQLIANIELDIGRVAGLIYDAESDMIYGFHHATFSVDEGFVLLSINPVDKSVSKVRLRTVEIPNECTRFIDSRQGSLVLSDVLFGGFIGSDLTFGRRVASYSSKKYLAAPAYNPLDQRFYGVNRGSDVSSNNDVPLEFLSISTIDGTEESKRVPDFEIAELDYWSCPGFIHVNSQRYCIRSSQGLVVFELAEHGENGIVHRNTAGRFMRAPVCFNQSEIVSDVTDADSDSSLESDIGMGEGLRLHRLDPGVYRLESETVLHGHLQVYSLLGQAVLERKLENVMSVDLDLSTQPVGSYFIRIYTVSRSDVQVFMVSH